MLNGRPQGDKSFVEMDQVYTSFLQGGLQRTHRSLDLAVDGTGFFEVLTPNGIRFTRQGNFSINTEGLLITIQGYPVLSRFREIREKASLMEINNQKKFDPLNIEKKPVDTLKGQAEVPPNLRTIRINPNIQAEISEDGTIYQEGKKIAQVNIEEFKENQWLEKVGNSYFRNDLPNNIKDGIYTSRVLQGFIETSNVNPVREMTKLIEVTRQYESHMQAIKTYQEIDGKTVNDIAGGR
jgi:flagellar basal-body rod protein FlgG